jgi:aspartate-semialdehyde dehydrogenase
MMSGSRLDVAIVGATGIVGQQFVTALDRHPWFRISCLAASEKSVGKTYEGALRDPDTKALRWYCSEGSPDSVLHMTMQDSSALDLSEIDLVFTALDSTIARKFEPEYARTKPVLSTASAFRYDIDVPILVPGVNLEHARLINTQRKRRGWEGFITPIPNCTTMGLVVTLKPMQSDFGIENVTMTSMQAVSGAGRSPGVLSLDVTDNVIPFIPGEEEKVQTETLKILGSESEESILPADFKVSCTCTRVNVLEGHTEVVYVSTRKRCDPDEVVDSMRRFGKQKLDLPSAPKELLVVKDDPFRPQPRLDRDLHGGMAVTVGRIRTDHARELGIKYVLVSHNTRLGAAKGAVLVSEHLVKSGYITAQ